MIMSTALLTFDDKGFSMKIRIFLMKSSAFFWCTELGVAIIAPSGLHFSRAVAMLEKYWVFNFFESSYASWLGSIIRSNIQFF